MKMKFRPLIALLITASFLSGCASTGPSPASRGYGAYKNFNEIGETGSSSKKIGEPVLGVLIKFTGDGPLLNGWGPVGDETFCAYCLYGETIRNGDGEKANYVLFVPQEIKDRYIAGGGENPDSGDPFWWYMRVYLGLGIQEIRGDWPSALSRLLGAADRPRAKAADLRVSAAGPRARTASAMDDALIKAIADSGDRYPVGYGGDPIWEKHITFTIGGTAVRNLNEVSRLFAERGSPTTAYEDALIQNFIGYVSENASAFADRSIDLGLVRENLSFMKAKRNLAGGETLSKAIAEAKKRGHYGWNGTPISENRIEFLVNGAKVPFFNEFPAVFKDQGIELRQGEIARIQDFMGYVAEHAKAYADLRFDLAEVRAAADGEPKPSGLQSEEATKAVLAKASESTQNQYSAEPFARYGISFSLNGARLANYNDLASLFRSQGIVLERFEADGIQDFIAYLAFHAESFPNAEYDLGLVRKNIELVYGKAPAEELTRWRGELEALLGKLPGYRPEPNPYDLGGITKNGISFYADSRRLGNPFMFYGVMKRAGRELNPLERARITALIGYLNENGASYPNMMVDLDAAYQTYAKTGDSYAELRKLPALAFLDPKEYGLKAQNDAEKDLKVYTFDNLLLPRATEQKNESRLMQEIDSVACGKTSIKDVLEKYGHPSKIVVAGQHNNIFVNYYYGGACLYFENQETVQEKRFFDFDSTPGDSYAYRGVLKFGVSLEDVLAALGKPASITRGGYIGYEKDVLYKDYDGVPGNHMIIYGNPRVQLYFRDGKLNQYILFD